MIALGYRSIPGLQRRGFTLIELLVSISILSILTALVAVAMVQAQRASREAKTKGLIASLNQLLMDHWEQYSVYRPPIKMNSSETRQQFMQRRLDSIRGTMRMDLPDRLENITNAPLPNYLPQTALSLTYASQLASATPQFQSAECLYQIITTATGDGDAREHFSQNDIGDVDGDGAPEFLDAWGTPIMFIRWPAGFESERQSYKAAANTGDGHNDHDPFDPMRLEPGAYRLVPLIYSAGADREFGITNPSNPDPGQGINPYASVGSAKLGNVFDAAQAADNIHNHMIQTR